MYFSLFLNQLIGIYLSTLDSLNDEKWFSIVLMTLVLLDWIAYAMNTNKEQINKSIEFINIEYHQLIPFRIWTELELKTNWIGSCIIKIVKVSREIKQMYSNEKYTLSWNHKNHEWTTKNERRG